MPDWNPADASTSPNSGSGVGGQQTFKATTALGFNSPQFSFGLGTYLPSMPRAAAHDSDYAGAPWGQQDTASNYQALQSLFAQDPDQVSGIQTLLNLAGYSAGNTTGRVTISTLNAYNKMLQDLAAYQTYDPSNPNAKSPDAFLAWAASMSNGKNKNGSGGSGGQPHTTTQSQVSYADPTQARALAHDTFTNGLGRNPNRKEQAAFEAALHAFEAAHPATSTTTYDGSGNSHTVSHQGGDESAFAQGYTHSTQQLANESGTMSEVGFVNVLTKLMGG